MSTSIGSRKLDAELRRRTLAGYDAVVVSGRAVGRDQDSLHVAFPDGVVAVPVAEIDRIDSSSSDDGEGPLVSLVVRRGASLRQLASIRSTLDDPGPSASSLSGPRGVPAPPARGYYSTSVSETTYSGDRGADDSTTRTMQDQDVN